MKLTPFLVITAMTVTAVQAQVTGSLQIKVDLPEAKVLALYDSIRAFRTDHNGEKACRRVNIADGTRFNDLPVGDWGIKVFAERKGKLHRLPIRIHTDDLCQEAGAPYSGGWEKNQFHMSKADMTISISDGQKKH